MSPTSISGALCLTAGAAVALCFSGQAQAEPVTKSFQFSASGFPAEAPQQTIKPRMAADQLSVSKIAAAE